MKKLYLLLIIALMTGTLSCRKHSRTTSSGNYDFMIIGTYYGECMGKCASFYQIKGGQLLQDTSVTYMRVAPGMNASEFRFNVVLPASKYALVQDLPSAVPQQLYSENGKVYGQPDAHDQGAVAVYISVNNVVYKWVIDPDMIKGTDDLAKFTERLGKALEQIRN